MMSLEQTKLGDILLVQKIATGGMAELWEGRQTGVESFEKKLAVKLLLPHLAKDEEFVRLFLDEARLAAQLNHTNICQIYNLGEAKNKYYIAMEYIDGDNVTSILRRASLRKTFVPLGFVCQLILGVCEALGYAHALESTVGQPLGIVHRDLSPPNVMVSKDGHVKVIDFGIAKAATQTHHTPTDIMRGKFAYMSPEYVLELPLDARSDIFSIGVVFWELTTGRRLFQADTEYGKMRKITQGNYPRPSQYRTDLPPYLESIIMRALCRDREERYPNCAMMQEDIERYLLTQNISLRPRRLASYIEWLFSNDKQPAPSPMTGQFPSLNANNGNDAFHQMTNMPLAQAPPTSVPPLAKVAPALMPPSIEETKRALEVVESSKPRILIADDHKEIRDTLDLLLTTQGYQVAAARDGLEALALLKSGPFDVCVLDLDMPRLNGKETLKQLQLLCPCMPCIIQTSDNSFQTATDMGRSGAFSYLVKPIKSRDLLAAIEKARQHMPMGEELEQTVLSYYPTPLAEAFHHYRRLPSKPSNLRERHRYLASQFELFAAWMGGTATGAYLADGGFSAESNGLIRKHIHQRIKPGDWFALLDHLSTQYTTTRHPHFSKRFRDMLHPSSWSLKLEQSRIKTLFTQLAPQLAIPIPSSAIRPIEALQLLSEYHQELWQHDAHLSDEDVSRNINCIEPFLRSLYRMIHRLTDFSFISVDAVEASENGIHHDLTHLQGLTPPSSSQLLPIGLDLNGIYLFDHEHTPMFSLFPFFTAGKCRNQDCGRKGISYLLQLKEGFYPIYQNTTCGHLQRLGESGRQRAQQHLSPLFVNENSLHSPRQDLLEQ